MFFRACLCVGVIASIGLSSATLRAREYRGMKKQNVDRSIERFDRKEKNKRYI